MALSPSQCPFAVGNKHGWPCPPAPLPTPSTVNNLKTRRTQRVAPLWCAQRSLQRTHPDLPRLPIALQRWKRKPASADGELATNWPVRVSRKEAVTISRSTMICALEQGTGGIPSTNTTTLSRLSPTRCGDTYPDRKAIWAESSNDQGQLINHASLHH